MLCCLSRGCLIKRYFLPLAVLGTAYSGSRGDTASLLSWTSALLLRPEHKCLLLYQVWVSWFRYAPTVFLTIAPVLSTLQQHQQQW